MTIETKFNVGDTVFYLHGNEIHSSQIREIKIEIREVSLNDHRTYISIVVINPYNGLNYLDPKPQEKFFASKQELIDSL